MNDGTVIGVIGAGAMGRGIAQIMATGGYRVVLVDTNEVALETALQAIATTLDKAIARNLMTPEDKTAALARITPELALESLASADLVIEAIVEQLEVKAGLFARLETICRNNTLFCTNTSSLSVTKIAAGLVHKSRLVGMHFFNPPHIMKLVEVIETPETPEDVITTVMQLARKIGKQPIRAKDRPGFVVNRCARPYYGEALCILEEGNFTAAQIDTALRSAGYRLGPFELIDLVGADINYAATLSVWEALERHPRYQPFDRLKQQVEAGKLGQKSGEGFTLPKVPVTELPPEAAASIVARIEATLINEAHFVEAEGTASRADIDQALLLGLNFPRGPFAMATGDKRNATIALLEELYHSAPDHLKERYTIAPNLTGSHHD
ncbi:3-hydroxyacyl-CoA dehydrogenase NAD-binding domain-containing protein [Kiloniella laminariae]|uniref:3-hydroxyacyl-CoA dehydrogenase NAD-binding domain-containing protein n=1 Tax=Kiloniella laminariae TaxID=454162 RepID=A0ABT4LNM4_9PROT|nr:3-hydroxyacyl-CoA dehydrogenase NAD-binding domain-containing protein [Kiloniella laminariae]MCZ4282693.1 3-hydroxyacyl-CoA dehydrogenase NAD-binding domain-containing protein [Kiloniella laminariae]